MNEIIEFINPNECKKPTAPDLMIRIKHLHKKYRLGRIGGNTLKADIESRWAIMRGKEDPNSIIGEKRKVGESFKALNNISLEIREGEAVGIIGRNGAGKSTLLKLLSRVTAPTHGSIEMWGRVTSMLEVGTGFHGEMTGRENIYMNGAILGMTKKEIDDKIEDIIEFSEVRDFIDTPVKRYSSGMFVKLAFSVAAHLDSEIMIMDEVLAVGDVAFQKKCLKKMREAAKEQGRTVLYVSHNMNTIRGLCDRCIVLDEGRIIFDGDVETAIEIYTAVTPQKLPGKYIYDKTYHNDLWKHPDFTIKEMCVTDRNRFVFDCGEDILLKLNVLTKQAFNSVKFRFEFSDMNENKLGSMWSKGMLDFKENERRELKVKINSRFFTPGQYKVDIVAFVTDAYGEDHFLDGVYPGFNMEISKVINEANPFVWHREWWGPLRMQEFEIE